MTIEAPAPYESPAPPARPARRRLWSWLVGAWAVLLLALAVWSAVHDRPTVQDQTTIASARATVDQTAERLLRQVPPGWVVDDQGYADSTCDLTAARTGTSTVRTITLSGPVGDESRTLTALVAGTPDVSMRPGEGPAESFFFDAGNFVAVRGKITGDGTLALDLSTGCRTRS
ncbi:hypothetical protein [Catellatospora tritici]|uniref:hypothetical protein n=1 Tax=Catellatospora tritici TaxID=2851566 RepID=UPI001C2D2EEF|nr:hypothetical protein [Catellatospora tritici]MBV1855411.1 hypothetical protein [Catellatospora tritici]